MLLTMAVTLYTSRIVLNTLGIEDFGIYNVVAGFVAMLGFLNNSMAVATQRFLSFEIGKKDHAQLSRVFSMSMSIHFLIAIVILLLAETVGLWFVKTQLTIPSERLIAAQWVYHFSIFAFIVNVVSVPYNAIIIAHERMNVFAWVSIIDVSLKLLIVFMLQWFGFDKLILYAVLMFIVSLIIRIIYGSYCSRNFAESKYRFYWDKPLFKTIMSFAGWSLWGSASSVLHSQGVNILLNIFFGPAINAARGIAFQVRGAVNSFVYNFQIAMNPQIIKSYATNDLKYMHQLIYQGAKYSFFLLFALSLPILFETEMILQAWLKIVPDHTVIFTQLVVINILIDSVSGPLMTGAQASGKIKVYQALVGSLLLLNLPASYLFLKLNYPPEVTIYISILISIVALFVRLLILQRLISISIKDFLKQVILKSLIVSLIATVLSLFIQTFFQNSFFSSVAMIIIAFTTSVITLYTLGLNTKEKEYLQLMLKKYYKKNND